MNPQTPAELIKALRDLAARVPITQEDLSALESDCLSLLLHFRVTPELAGAPDAIWHFLADADIRFKDANYANGQISGLLTAVAKWELQLAA